MGWREDEADATRDPTMMDAISEAEANASRASNNYVIGKVETNARAALA
jgi:hypothetical protein